VVLEIELVTASAEISHPHSVARRYARIAHRELSLAIKSTSKHLSRQHEKKNKTHVTTDNADVTDGEEEDANSRPRLSAAGSIRKASAFFPAARRKAPSEPFRPS
jgi:hypothetical protein